MGYSSIDGVVGYRGQQNGVEVVRTLMNGGSSSVYRVILKKACF